MSTEYPLPRSDVNAAQAVFPVDPATGTVRAPSVGSVALTDASIANAAGSSETVAAANTARRRLVIANPSASVSWWINPSGGTAAANTAGSFELPPGGMWAPVPPPTNAVTGIATAGTDLTVAVG